jgi:broad specificity phosphatase PhoE
MELIFVRHGETEWSRKGRHTGSTDLPLLDEGRSQARSAAGAISRILGGREPIVYTSPLRRARETARIVGLGGKARISTLLREYDYGDYEGLLAGEIRDRHSEWNLWIHGCPGGETIEQAGARADSFLAAAAGAAEPVLVFSHGHMIRIIAARALGLPASQGRIFAIDTASVSVVKDVRGKPAIWLWNYSEQPARA